MTSKRNLASRLARRRNSLTVFVAAAAILACNVSARRVGGPAAQVVQIVVVPDNLTVDPGQQVSFAAYGRDALGDSAAVTVSWSTTGGAITSGGLFTAGATTGDFSVTATNALLQLSGSASVQVRIRPVASLTVSPPSASVAIGQTAQLTATPRDANGAALSGRVVTWSSDNTSAATVNSNGLVSGVGAGSATITATSEGKSGTSTITVTAAGGGGTILVQENFDDAAIGSRGWYDNTSTSISTTEHIAGSTGSLEIRFRAGASQPTWGSATRHALQPTETVYLSFWVKYSTNWVGSGQSYHPHEFYFMTTENADYDGPAFTHLTAYVEDNYQSGGYPVLALQDGQNIDQTKVGQNLTTVTENRSAQGCNGNTDGYVTDCYDMGNGQFNNGKTWKSAQPAFLANPGPGYKNDWHFVEAYFQLNSIQNGKGRTDGIVRYWVDGNLVIDHTNVLMRTGVHNTMKFDQFLIGPYIGGGSSVDQTMWIDNLTVATAKP